MGENELMEHRVCELEKDVETLYTKANTAAISQAETNIKLDNVLLAIGELKGIVSALSARPGKWWDKIIAAGIGAVTTALVATAVSQIIK